MTDLEKLKALLTEFGAAFDEDQYADGSRFVTIRARTKKVDGYCGFHADFEFTSDGAFVKAGVWE